MITKTLLYLFNLTYKKIRLLRKHLIENDNYKMCFKCEEVLPLNKFQDNNKKFQRPAAKGKNFLCDGCIKKRENLIN